MARIRGRDTKPEMKLRSALHRAGLRFRVCRNDLPGRPDVVFAGPKVAVQVRGCFWHQHEGCKTARVPSSNVDYWGPKLRRTVERDTEKDEALRALGWRVLVVWECEIKSEEGLAAARKSIAESVRHG
ncbi:MAG: DNA mismatch endonuclease Vsr [Planctomycetales bacterium]|nr:DNA mismatch endonuclease Vsr [Planctomycetales bacterium]